jgi:hypothetical protein
MDHIGFWGYYPFPPAFSTSYKACPLPNLLPTGSPTIPYGSGRAAGTTLLTTEGGRSWPKGAPCLGCRNGEPSCVPSAGLALNEMNRHTSRDGRGGGPSALAMSGVVLRLLRQDGLGVNQGKPIGHQIALVGPRFFELSRKGPLVATRQLAHMTEEIAMSSHERDVAAQQGHRASR